MGALKIILLVLVLLVAFYIFCGWKLFAKAGKPGWAIFVPIYNIVVQFQIAKLSPWLILLYLLVIIPILGPILALVLNIFVSVKTCSAFGKGVGFTIGYILLGFIFMPILALDSSEYNFDVE